MTERAADPRRGHGSAGGPGRPGPPPTHARPPQPRPPHGTPARLRPPQARPHHHPGPPPSELPTRRVTASGPGHGQPYGEGPAARRWRSRAVALARVLAGGLVMLALTVLGAPLVLGGPGPGTGTVVAHVVAAVVAVTATALAAHRRAPTPVALAAGLAVPVTLLVLLWSSWWA